MTMIYDAHDSFLICLPKQKSEVSAKWYAIRFAMCCPSFDVINVRRRRKYEHQVTDTHRIFVTQQKTIKQ